MSNKNMKKANKSGKSLLIIIIILLLILAAVVGVILIKVLTQKPAEDEEEAPKDNHKGVVGVVSDDWDPNVEETVGEPKKGTQIPGYSSAEMNAGDTSLHLSIGNPKENSVGMFATLRLADGTVLYESPLLKPGQGLTDIPLSKSLEKGTYDAVVVYQCVLLDEDNTPLNAAESGFTLYVN